MYQALAIRELHGLSGMAEARKESQPTRPRQDKADPQYMRFDVAQTPLGRAFGWSASSAGTMPVEGNICKQASLLQRPCVTQSLKIATVRPPDPHPNSAAGAVPLSDFRLVNPHSLCYVNASIMALLHVREATGLQEDALDSQTQH